MASATVLGAQPARSSYWQLKRGAADSVSFPEGRAPGITAQPLIACRLWRTKKVGELLQ
jgi:hypothetical protein